MTRLKLIRKTKKHQIPISYIEDKLDYDSISGAFTWKNTRSHTLRGQPAGYVTPNGYLVINLTYMKEPYHFMAHHIAWLLFYGKDPSTGIIDHINRNKLDNRISNLRECTANQNNRNATKSTKTSNSSYSSEYRGVIKHVMVGTGNTYYRASIHFKDLTHRKIPLALGTYDTELDAAYAYDNAARELHGEFAVLNFPNEIRQVKPRLNSTNSFETYIEAKRLWELSENLPDIRMAVKRTLKAFDQAWIRGFFTSMGDSK